MVLLVKNSSVFTPEGFSKLTSCVGTERSPLSSSARDAELAPAVQAL